MGACRCVKKTREILVWRELYIQSRKKKQYTVRETVILISHIKKLRNRKRFPAIRNHDQIKSICVLGTECKLSQYADDTTLILDGSDNSVHQSFSLLDSFATISGLRINYEKTEAL